MKQNKYHKIILGLLISITIGFFNCAYSQTGDRWIVTGGDSHANIIMTNEVTGEVVSTFCIDASLDLPWMGDVFHLDASGEYLVPENSELQRMYIHRKTCDYKKPILNIPTNCTGSTNTVTATCELGTPKWYRYTGTIDLNIPYHVGSSVTINSTGLGSQWYVMCANEDNSCKSDIVSLGKLDGLDSGGHPSNVRASNSSICLGQQTELLSDGCVANIYGSLYNVKWFTNSGLTNAVGGNIVSPGTTTTYYAACVDAFGCISGASRNVQVEVNPIPSITAGTPVCAPDGLTYSVTFTIPAGATLSATTSGTITGSTVSGIGAGTSATVTVESAEGCKNTTTVNHTCTVPVFDLALRKVMPNGTKNTQVTPGSSVTFKIEVWNQGNVDATDITVIDYIPAGLILNDPNWTPGTGVATLTAPIPALAAGDSMSVAITFTVDETFSGSTIRNFAEISGADNTEGLEDIDSAPDSNPDNDGTPVDDKIDGDHKNNPGQDEDDHDYEDLVVTPTPVFDLALRKTMAQGSKNIYRVGDVVTFNITVFNQGTVAATSIDLVDYIPVGLTLQVGSGWTLDGNKARWAGAITNLTPGAQETVSISFVVNISATRVVINTAEISGATNTQNLEDIDSTPDDDKDNDGSVKNDVINEDGKNNFDEDDHDIEQITVCLDAKCLPGKSVRNK